MPWPDHSPCFLGWWVGGSLLCLTFEAGWAVGLPYQAGKRKRPRLPSNTPDRAFSQLAGLRGPSPLGDSGLFPFFPGHFAVILGRQWGRHPFCWAFSLVLSTAVHFVALIWWLRDMPRKHRVVGGGACHSQSFSPSALPCPLQGTFSCPAATSHLALALALALAVGDGRGN